MKNDLETIKSKIFSKKLFLLDLDGTVYLGRNLFPKTLEFLNKIISNGGRYVFLTNNSSKSSKDYVTSITQMGIPCSIENVFSSTDASINLIKEKYPNSLVYAQGTKSFIKQLKEDGLNVTESFKNDIQLILVGFDRELTMDKLTTTCEVLTKLDVPYFATNCDWVCPTEFGFVPDCGSMCFSLQKATGKSPTFIGKPEAFMIDLVLKKFGVEKKDAILFGDRLYTDIKSGNNAKIDTVLVLSGETKKEDLKKDKTKPTYTLNGVWDLVD